MGAPRFRFAPRVFELADRGPLVHALRALRSRPGLALLDSAAGEPKRFSVLGFDPLPLALVPERGVFGLRDALHELAPAAGDSVPGFFAGGLLAALAYDLGVAGETRVVLPPEPWGFPLVLGGLYVDFLVRDERAERTWLVLGDEPGDGRPPLATRRAAIEAEFARDVAPGPVRRTGELVRQTSSAEHRERIERCRAAIGRGELYQANLAHRFTCAVRGDPVDLYAKLRERNPAPYMGFLSFTAGSGASGDPRSCARRGALLSCSPELFLELDGELARTRPIKGTIARSADPVDDARRREALLASEKDLAELVMIVDLERNDLGRVALPGSVRVEGYPTLASYARVHHLMADVVARPRPGVDAFDLVAALFPGGSISGCPKLAALAHIAELEGEGRGFFCGSFGAFSLDGRANLNVLIRTLQWRPGEHGVGEVSFRVGGGITFSSDASAEDRETLIKAAGIVDALDAP